MVSIAYGFQWRFSKECNDMQIKPYKNPKLKEVIKIDMESNLITIYASATEASKELKIPKHVVVTMCKNECKNNLNYQLMYKEDYEELLITKQND